MLVHTTRHVYSGMCICGHHADDHHGNCIMKTEAIEAMSSCTMFGECERYGVNEGWHPCPDCCGFIDKDDPLRLEKLIELSGKDFKVVPMSREESLDAIIEELNLKEDKENIIRKTYDTLVENEQHVKVLLDRGCVIFEDKDIKISVQVKNT